MPSPRTPEHGLCYEDMASCPLEDAFTNRSGRKGDPGEPFRVTLIDHFSLSRFREERQSQPPHYSLVLKPIVS